MKLLSVLALAAASVSTAAAASVSAAAANDYKHARVVPGVLPADSIAKLHGQAGAARLLRKKLFGDTPNRKHGEAAVEPDDLKRILKSIDDDRQVGWTINLRSTIITGNTDPHTDVKINDGVELDEDEDVMIVFLNDNEDAHFQVGEDMIQVEAGTAVIFKGNKVVHNTIVRSGEVRLLGPISSRDLQDVGEGPPCCSTETGPDLTKEQCKSSIAPECSEGGCCDIVGGDVDVCFYFTSFCPTESPTKNPTESPTKNPTESPTKNPTESPTVSWCPGVEGTDFCLDGCVQCTTDDELPGCVYHHEVGKGKCSLQCISCGSTCGIENAKGKNKNDGKPKPVPGCASQCVNEDEYLEACD